MFDPEPCTCLHDRSAHPDDGPCRGRDSYRARCTCHGYDTGTACGCDDDDFRPDHWLCVHGLSTDGTAGHCGTCDEAGLNVEAGRPIRSRLDQARPWPTQGA